MDYVSFVKVKVDEDFLLLGTVRLEEGGEFTVSSLNPTI
jgi:hypothetical protein